MELVRLADTGRETSRLGFGCSSLMGSMGRHESLRTLEWAFDAGIRHFDVAPMYGYGQAESCLGEFLARHSGEVTVATKFGIPPAHQSGMNKTIRTLARPLLKLLPALKSRAQRAAATVTAPPAAARNLSAAEAETSLHSSLRHLRTSRIDLFLLHDAKPEEVRDNAALLAFLERSKEQGLIGGYGVGTDRDYAARIQQESPAFARVVQQEWSVFDPLEEDSSFHIHHRSLSSSLRRLNTFLEASPQAAKLWSDETGTDLLAKGKLSDLMMIAALQANPNGIVLFSSKSDEHIRSNARLLADAAGSEQATILYRLVQRDRQRIAMEAPS